MYKLTTTFIAAFSLTLVSLTLAGCFESSSEVAPPPAIEPPPIGVDVGVKVGVVGDGQIYYQNRCATCHSAGRDDPVSAFGAVDLAQKQDMITVDISDFDETSGFNLMGAFSDIAPQRVADLKAYLESVPAL